MRIKILGISRYGLSQLSQLKINRCFFTRKPELVLKDKNKPMNINVELPDPSKGTFIKGLGFFTFVTFVGCAFLAIVNYERTQSPIVTNSMYKMRRSKTVKNLLGEKIMLDGLIPWVYGDLNQVAGIVDVKFYVKGTKNVPGVVTLVANRTNKHEEFLLREWTVKVGDVTVDLLKEDGM